MLIFYYYLISTNLHVSIRIQKDNVLNRFLKLKIVFLIEAVLFNFTFIVLFFFLDNLGIKLLITVLRPRISLSDPLFIFKTFF